MSEKDSRIKLVLLIDQAVLPCWQYQMVERLQLIEHVELVLVLQDNTGQKRPFIKRIFSRVLSLTSLLEKYLFGWEGNARKNVDISPLLNNAPVLDMPMNHIMGRQYFEQSGADLLIDLRSGAQQPDYPDYCYASSTQQVWRYFYDETGSAELLRAGVVEFCAGNSMLNSGVLSESKGADRICLLWSSSGVDRPFFTQNVDQMLWKLVDFIPSLLRENSTVEALLSLRRNRVNYHNTLTALKFSSVSVSRFERFYFLALLKLSRRGLLQFGVKVLSRLGLGRAEEQWILLLGQKKALATADGLQAISSFKKIIPPSDRFWADPFLVSWSGQDYVFFEELIYSEGKGTLVCMSLQDISGFDGSKPFIPPLSVLEKPHHLSYPFVFQYQNVLYMIPESAENKTLDIYRCEQFPHQWTWVKTLMSDVAAYDATLYEDEQGEWWMFVCMRHHEYASTNELLYLFSAASPLSDEWVSHPANPIVTDAATARPAGQLLKLDGKLYRPSQNCAGSYGRGLNLNEIITLNHQEYHEKTSSRLIPAGYSELDGVHTLNCLNDTVISDGIFRRK